MKLVEGTLRSKIPYGEAGFIVSLDVAREFAGTERYYVPTEKAMAGSAMSPVNVLTHADYLEEAIGKPARIVLGKHGAVEAFRVSGIAGYDNVLDQLKQKQGGFMHRALSVLAL